MNIDTIIIISILFLFGIWLCVILKEFKRINKNLRSMRKNVEDMDKLVEDMENEAQ